MAVSNVRKYVSVLSVLKKECAGCGHEFSNKDTGIRIAKTNTNRLFCWRCQASDFDMEAYCCCFD